ncbi:unnamed protein product [Nezara viridula]|uniref:MIR domain-containing protein n=1 Tax=Nezara viridula TaxID=85310 RepID=A0A9P0HVI2_NEZVI|nr:unnamed protein product [Nezara viridula]
MLSVRIIVTMAIMVCCFRMSCDGTAALYVTFGSVVKLRNLAHNARLHSLEMKYSGGSSQQMVTAVYDEDDVESNWIVKAVGVSVRGQPIQCGDTVRLEHLSTAKNLHSHTFRSPLSGNQEVTAFGENGAGDRGDTWRVMCKRMLWRRDSPVLLRHHDTGGYLMVSGREYHEPILGMLEVAAGHLCHEAYWQVAEGLYVHPDEHRTRHTEL